MTREEFIKKWVLFEDGQMVKDLDELLTPSPSSATAEEINKRLAESLGEPDNSIEDHTYEIRPLTVEGRREWWIFHKEVGSGEPLKQWLGNFATLHAQKIADKMVSEKLKKEYERGIEDGKIIQQHGSTSYIE